MEIREAREGEVIVLSPDGNLAAGEETSALESKLAALQKAGARQVVIDCTSVGQLTSVAIRALLLASRKLGRAQGRLVLYGMNAKVRKAFAISGFDKDFTILATRSEALAAAVGPAAVPESRAATPTATRVPDPVAEQPVPAAAAVPVEAGPQPEAALPPVSAPAVPPPPPAVDRRAAQAGALLGALGVHILPPSSTASRPVETKAREAAAEAVLAALRAGRR